MSESFFFGIIMSTLMPRCAVIFNVASKSALGTK
ncbi:Uncharacterised protein [Vibrio cholerae]|nr:Uncharacterised protein [Vibrio cholerae]